MLNNFNSELMGHKSVIEIPGVCNETEQILKAHNIKEASEIYGRFLMFNKDKAKFKIWLNKLGITNEEIIEMIYVSLSEYHNNFF